MLWLHIRKNDAFRRCPEITTLFYCITLFGRRLYVSCQHNFQQLSVGILAQIFHKQAPALACPLPLSTTARGRLDLRCFYALGCYLLHSCSRKGVLFSRPYSPVRRSLTQSLRTTKYCVRFRAVYEIFGLGILLS